MKNVLYASYLLQLCNASDYQSPVRYQNVIKKCYTLYLTYARMKISEIALFTLEKTLHRLFTGFTKN